MSPDEAPNYDHIWDDIAWSSQPECAMDLNDAEAYCAFNSRTFANGRGISIVSTPGQISEILELPAFMDHSIHRSLHVNDYSAPPFAAHEIHDHGIGLIANRTIARGETLMTFTPAFMITDDIYTEVDETGRHRLQRHAFEHLPEPLRDTVYGLAVQGQDIDWIDDILDTNSFGFSISTLEDGEDDYVQTGYRVVFPEIAVSARIPVMSRPSGAKI
jgi:hypothetical protein